MSAWAFSDPPNVASFTVRDVMQKRKPILLVCHDSEDGAWQFLTGEPADTADAMLVGLKEIVDLDSSVLELVDLPLGWQASRETQQSPWTRSQIDSDDA
jgi:hypothetical protein